MFSVLHVDVPGASASAPDLHATARTPSAAAAATNNSPSCRLYGSKRVSYLYGTFGVQCLLHCGPPEREAVERSSRPVLNIKMLHEQEE